MATGERVDDTSMTESNLSLWIDESIRLLGGSTLVVDSHIDEILRAPGRTWSASGAVELVEAGAKSITPGWTGRLSLAIPLETHGPDLKIKAPELSSLELNRAQPPSLYVFGTRFFLSTGLTGEEYHAGYGDNPWNLNADEWSVEFSSFKDREARNRGWEPSDTVWVHYIAGR